MKTLFTVPSRFLTMTFFVYIRLAVNVRHTVTVASSPSGTCVARRRHDTTAWALWRPHRRRRGGAVSWRRHRRDDGPDVFQRLEIQKETTLMDTTGRRETHVRHDDANHKHEGRHGVLAHAERRREERDAQREGDGRDDLDEVVDLLVDRRLLRFLRGTTQSRN